MYPPTVMEMQLLVARLRRLVYGTLGRKCWRMSGFTGVVSTSNWLELSLNKNGTRFAIGCCIDINISLNILPYWQDMPDNVEPGTSGGFHEIKGEMARIVKYAGRLKNTTPDPIKEKA